LELSSRFAASLIHVNRPDDGAMPSDDPRFRHQQQMQLYVIEHDLRASIRVSDQLYAETLFPLRFVGISWSEGHERVFGAGDVEATVRARVSESSLRLDLRFGVSLPFGESGPLFDGSELRERYLFGSGTFDPIAGFQGSVGVGRDRLSFYGWARMPFMENVFDVRAGLRSTIGAAYVITRPSWGLTFGAGHYHQSAAKVPNLAHSLSAAHDDLFLSAGVELWRLFELGFVLPLTLRVGEAGAYHSPWTLSFTTRFGL
jgi:hypothetical protein